MVYSGSFLGRLLFLRIELPISRAFSPPKVQEMSSTRKVYNVNAHTKGAVSFFVACSDNPATTLKIPAMRAKGYSDTEAVDKALQVQLRWEVRKLKKGFGKIPSTAQVVSSGIESKKMIRVRTAQ